MAAVLDDEVKLGLTCEASLDVLCLQGGGAGELRTAEVQRTTFGTDLLHHLRAHTVTLRPYSTPLRSTMRGARCTT